MPLRYQLLLLAMLTLLLPWAGWRYAREMESVLRDGERQALLATATALANVLGTDEETHIPLNAQFDPGRGDLYVHRLRAPPLLDGYADDWGIPESAFHSLTADSGTLAVRYAAATDGQHGFLLFKVADNSVRLDSGADTRLPPEQRADHIWLSLRERDGAGLYLFSAGAPGLTAARRPVESARGERDEILDPRLRGWWQPDPAGYRLEIALPLQLLAGLLGFEVVDVSDGVAPPQRLGTLNPHTREPESGVLLMSSLALSARLAALLPPGMHATLAGPAGWVMAEARVDVPEREPSAASLPIADTDAPRASWVQTLYRRVLESAGESPPLRPHSPGRIAGAHAQAALAGRAAAARFRLPDERRSVLAAAAPVHGGGALVLEHTADRLLVLRDRALKRLMDLTLLGTAAAVLAIFVFAATLGIRLTRLKRAAETALTRDGRVNAAIPGTGARDELGALARSYQRLLQQLNEYTEYLRTLAGKLSHELRTPLTVVRSSIENLEAQPSSEAAALYLARARAGADRLEHLLTAMSAATRTEEAIRQAERKSFDLNELVRSITRAYADAFPGRRFAAALPPTATLFDGAPDLIVQALDKLTDNAVDFSPAGSLIELELKALRTGEVELCVVNDGPPLSPGVLTRVFESMFQQREGTAHRAGTVHFGLGLYVVRLIAEFHAGEVIAENLPRRAAVRFGMRLPSPRA